MTTSKKVTARTVSAPVAVKPRAEFVAFAKQITEARTSLSQICYQAAMCARTNSATKEENALLKAVVTKQQWSDMNKIITCSHKLPKTAPANLVKLAQFIRALDKGATAAQAKQHAEGKVSAKELGEKINGKAAPAPIADTQSRDTQLPIAPTKGKTPYTLLEEAIAAVAVDVTASKSKAAIKALEDLRAVAAVLVEAMANG